MTSTPAAVPPDDPARKALVDRMVAGDWDAYAEWFALGGVPIRFVGEPVMEP